MYTASPTNGNGVNAANVETVIKNIIYPSRNKHKAGSAAPAVPANAWGEFASLYCWMPGNLFYGPKKAPGVVGAWTGHGRTDDPSNGGAIGGFETKAAYVVGSANKAALKKFRDLQAIDEQLKAFITSPTAKKWTVQAVNKLSRKLAYITLKRGETITPLNANGWTHTQSGPGAFHFYKLKKVRGY